MSRARAIDTALACALILFFSSVLAARQPGSAPPAAQGASVKRGEYLVRIMGCHDCHTPMKMGPKGPEPDMSRALSGHPASMTMPPAPGLTPPWFWAGAATMTAFVGPWGVSFTANLTPDQETGLGAWTEQMFAAAMRNGRHMGVGRPILPPMPFWAAGALTDADLHDLFTYLRSLPPMKNAVPAPIEPPEPGGH